ncbi:MAG: preprotein translocase subunit SecE [Candidatus Berkelbacteria bacterium]|nr:preprotein translocase subunit SecE [Candidatus Berkelbacteria bacterium]
MKNNKVIKYFFDSYQELRRVTWPTRKQIINDTTIVIISGAVVTAFIALIDLGLSSLIQYLISLKA